MTAAETDAFARTLLEEAKRFLEKAGDESDVIASSAYLHAALMLAFCSIEAHVNAIIDDFIERPELSVHEKAILLEREVRMNDGAFELKGFKISKFEDRIQLLHAKFGGESIDTAQQHWCRLAEATKLRNQLTHPKEMIALAYADVARAVQAIVDALDSLYQAIYGRPFPAAGMALNSKLNF